MHALLHSVPPTLQQDTSDPCLHCILLDTQGHVWISLLWGSFLGPGALTVLCVPSKSLFPQSCVSFGGSMVGLMVTSSKSIIPYPSLMHTEPLPLQQSTADPYLFRRHSNTVLPESLGPGAHKVCLNPLSICGRYGV